MPKINSETSEEFIKKTSGRCRDVLNTSKNNVRKERERIDTDLHELKKRTGKAIKTKELRRLYHMLLDPHHLENAKRMMNDSLRGESDSREETKSLKTEINDASNDSELSGEKWLEDFLRNTFAICMVASDAIEKYERISVLQSEYEEKYTTCLRELEECTSACITRSRTPVIITPTSNREYKDYKMNDIPFKSKNKK
jgi:hypothetical protein